MSCPGSAWGGEQRVGSRRSVLEGVCVVRQPQKGYLQFHRVNCFPTGPAKLGEWPSRR